jgi:hypothetical protein
MSRTRRNSGLIGRKLNLKNYNRSGTNNLDDVVGSKLDEGSIVDAFHKYTPPMTWPQARNTDPYYNTVRVHLQDSDVANHLIKDQSGNNWDTYTTINAYQRAPIATHFGPRYTDWCSDFYENGYYTVSDAAALRFGSGNFDISFWIKLRKQDANQYYVMGKGSGTGVTAGNNTGWVIGINTSYQLFFFDANGTGSTTTNGTVLERDRWYFIHIYRSGTTLYCGNNVTSGANYITGTSGQNFADTNPLYVGVDRSAATGATVSFQGRIYDLRIRTGVAGTVSMPSGPIGSDANTVFYQSGGKPHHDDIPFNAGGNRTVVTNNNVFRYRDGPFLYVDRTATPIVSNQTTLLTGNGAHSLNFWNVDAYMQVWDVQTGNTSLRFGTGGFTVECWVYGSTSSLQQGQNNGIIGKGSGNTSSGSGWSLWVDSSGYVRWDDASQAINCSPNNPIRFGGWYHIAASRVGTAANQFYIYVNGNLTYQGTVSTDYSGTETMVIGNSRNNQYSNWNGYICGLRLSNTGRYSGSGSPYNVELSTFKDSSMAVDANTVYLIGTTGTQDPANGGSHYRDAGQSGCAPVRHSSEIITNYNPYSRTGHSAFPNRDTNTKLVVTQNGSNFAFSTNNFSVEMWIMPHWLDQDNTTFRTLWCTQAAYSDAGLWLRRSFRKSYELHGNNNIIIATWEDFSGSNIWNHILVQRVNGNLAIYVNGRKRAETIYTTTITCPSGRFYIGNCYSSNHRTDSGATTGFSDIRVVNGSAPYASGNYNPNYIEVPRNPLTAVSNCTLLISALNSGFYDASGQQQRVEPGGPNDPANPYSFEIYSVSYGPYQGIQDWDRTKQMFGQAVDTARGMDAYGPVRGDSTYPDYSWITRLTNHNPWTIECWHWVYMTQIGAPGPGNNYASLYTATSGGHEGWRIIVHQSNTSASYCDITFEWWTAHNSGVQRMYSSSNYLRNIASGYAWWHIAVCWDNTKGSKLAIFVNGYRVATSGTFTQGQKMWNTYRLQHSGQGTGPVRISTTARYNNDSGTYTMPTTRWAYDQYTYSLIDVDEPFANKAGAAVGVMQYGVLPSYKYKRFGNASMKFGQKNPSLLCERILAQHWGQYNYLMDFRINDCTMECWAMYWDSTAGGPGTGAQGRALWQYSNNLIVMINSSGYWRFLNGNSTNPANGTFSGNSAYSTGYDYNPSTYYASTTTSGTFDHLVLMRRGGEWYFYINGIEAFIMFGTGMQTTGDQGHPDYVSSPGTTTINIAHDTYSQSGISWAGFIQDFRVSAIARYETRAKRFTPITFTVSSSSGAIITTTTSLNNLCVMTQPVTFASNFGNIVSSTTYYITNVFDNNLTVATTIGGVPVQVGTTTGQSIVATTQDKTVSAMCHAQTDTFALPTALFPSY